MNERDLFIAALHKEQGERAAFLAEACGHDADLRQRIERLLRLHADAGSFLQKPAVPPGETTDSKAGDSPGEPDDLLVRRTRRDDAAPLGTTVGDRIGPYKLVQRLGEGGMGVVWVAEQTEPVKRRVALKVIKPGMDSEQVLHRFEAERQALALMDHTNIARVLDAGTTPEGRPYFVMELIKGVPITKYCDELHLTLRERLELFVPVCEAIQHAHQKGIIHRDVKPSNVLVAVQDGKPVPRVIDFGVAKALHQRLTDQSMYTEIGQVVGTLEYMSPEQAELSALDIDTRADIYALGVLLYELLTGTTPLEPKRLKAAALLEVLRLIREVEPPKPSTRLSESKESLASLSAQRRTQPVRLMKEVRGELDWIVMRCLEKDRMRRYETASALANDVQRYLKDEPVEACPPSAGYRLRKFARRYRAALAIAAAFAVLLVLGAVVGIWLAVRATAAEGRARSAQTEAEADRDRARTAERLAAQRQQRAEKAEKKATVGAAIVRAVNDFLQKDLLGQADVGNQVGGRQRNLTVRELLDRAARQIEGKFRGQELTEAAIRLTLGNAYRALGEFDQAHKHLERALALRRRNLGASHPDTLTALDDLAFVQMQLGRYDEAEKRLKQVLEATRARWGADHPETLQSLGYLGLLYHMRGRYDEAEKLLAQVAKGLRARLGPNHADTLTSLSALAMLYRTRGRYDEAEEMLERVVRGRQAALGADHPVTLATRHNLATVYQMHGRQDAAEKLFARVHEASRTLLGDDHPLTLGSKNHLAMIYNSSGRTEQAAPLFVQVLAAYRRKLGPDHPETLASMHNLAICRLAAGRDEEGQTLVEQALKGWRAQRGAGHADTLSGMNTLAMCHLARGRYQEAEKLLEQVVPAAARLRANPPLIRRSKENLARTRLLKQLAQRYEEVRRAKGEADVETLLALRDLAGGFAGLNNAVAERLLLKVLEGFKGRPGDDPLILWTQDRLAEVYIDGNQLERARPLLADRVKRGGGHDNLDMAISLYRLACTLMSRRRDAEAEPLLRECLAILASKQPDSWTAFDTKSRLGETLLRQKKYADAEPLLLQGYEGLRQRSAQIPPIHQARLSEALDRLVQFYEARGQKDRAAAWRKKHEEMKGR
jgi:serine/threonine protein kinase/tetratricopeptide (TPR) repeat protein